MAKASIVLTGLKGGSSFDLTSVFAKAGLRRNVSEYHDNQIIYSQEDPVDALFYIEKGALKVTIHSKHGKKAVVAMLGAGDFFGEESLTDRSRRIATVATIASASIVRIEKATMSRLFRDAPKFADLFISYLAARKIRVEDDLVDQLLNSSEKRLARRLLLLNDLSDGSRPKTLIRINQDTLAAMVGTTQSRVSFFMNKFRRSGFIEYNGDLKVHRSLSTVLLK